MVETCSIRFWKIKAVAVRLLSQDLVCVRCSEDCDARSFCERIGAGGKRLLGEVLS